MTTVVSLVSVISLRFGRFGGFVLVVSVVSFRCFGLVHAVTFQTGHVGKDKLYGVGKGEHVLLTREGRKVKIIAIFICFGGSSCFVPVVSFQWFRRFRPGGFVPVFLVLVRASQNTAQQLV